MNKCQDEGNQFPSPWWGRREGVKPVQNIPLGILYTFPSYSWETAASLAPSTTTGVWGGSDLRSTQQWEKGRWAKKTGAVLSVTCPALTFPPGLPPMAFPGTVHKISIPRPPPTEESKRGGKERSLFLTSRRCSASESEGKKQILL